MRRSCITRIRCAEWDFGPLHQTIYNDRHSEGCCAGHCFCVEVCYDKIKPENREEKKEIGMEPRALLDALTVAERLKDTTRHLLHLSGAARALQSTAG